MVSTSMHELVFSLRTLPHRAIVKRGSTGFPSCANQRTWSEATIPPRFAFVGAKKDRAGLAVRVAGATRRLHGVGR